eukprot:TRINITY_DN14080_c0_g1_i5.p1 TRINITY_DN14080_c0_g1~~TRINITY_DN14080_c0_g1_i5.p1  ORF type:complete len:120 (-),score=5.13 TRINITY_DN14080_c0_g1_i5:114-473(-)
MLSASYISIMQLQSTISPIASHILAGSIGFVLQMSLMLRLLVPLSRGLMCLGNEDSFIYHLVGYKSSIYVAVLIINIYLCRKFHLNVTSVERERDGTCYKIMYHFLFEGLTPFKSVLCI